MTYNADQWRHLGVCLRAERNGRSRAEVAEATGISAGTIENYEKGRCYQRPPDKLWRLVRFYGWSPDSLRRVLEGGRPTYLPGREPAPAPAPAPAPPLPHGGIELRLRELIDAQSNLSTREKRRMLRHFDDLLRAERPDLAPPGAAAHHDDHHWAGGSTPPHVTLWTGQERH